MDFDLVYFLSTIDELGDGKPGIVGRCDSPLGFPKLEYGAL
jgi:hypothetical protein